MSTTYTIDLSHSSVGFTVRHLVITKVRGRFAQFSGSIELDEADLTNSKVSAEIDAGSINTSEEKRDAHLRSADFFDVEKFPKLTFTSSKIEKHGDALKMTGALTLHGVTKDVTLDVEHLGAAKDPWGGSRVSFEARGSLDRRDFGLHWNAALEAGGVLVGEKVELSLDIQAIKA
jgi:polyisoprenoid-binding protein YceI